MDAEFKKKWVEALRSGKYRQAQEMLKSQIDLNLDGTFVWGYCCLGVLCDIHPEVQWVNQYEVVYNNDYDKSSVTSLPLELRVALDISLADETRLIGMNDDEGSSFSEIADWIEKNL